jgi:hypothetical protein
MALLADEDNAIVAVSEASKIGLTIARALVPVG